MPVGESKIGSDLTCTEGPVSDGAILNRKPGQSRGQFFCMA